MILSAFVFAFGACDDETEDDTRNQMAEFSYEFDSGMEGWEGDFADYPIGESEDYELEYEYSTLPEPLDEEEGALRMSGTNMSDDLFMFIKRKITDLDPSTTYEATFSVQFASDVPDGMVGVGGSPGESVIIKAGATTIEPVPVEDDMDYYRMNIDKTSQSGDASDMIELGDFSNDTDQEVYTLKTVTSDQRFQVTTNQNGELWLIVGTESGFEANTNIFYNTIQATFYMEE